MPEEQAVEESPGTARENAYAHLAGVFTELAALPDDDPRRPELRDRLITGYLPVARNIAHRFVHRGDVIDDLEQVATLGLIGAVDRFEPGRGIDFLSFAVPTITGEVRRHFRDRVRTIRIPRKISQLQGAVHECTTELTQRLGRAPRPSELAARLQVPLDDIIEVLQAHHAAYPSSLDEPGPDDDTAGRPRIGALGEVDPGINLVDDRMAVIPLLANLPERERRILQLRFFHDMTQTEIAALTGISQMHVSRLLARTLSSLRNQLTVEV
ncbi:MAG TPA: SigB/SigF/SigG family RNA polymerase sigma factor [Pseudonocardia sp.]|jgi:RNA polymerase sigma-B factor